MNDSAMIRSFMGGLISKVGGYDAAASYISARLGHDISKGTISKRQSGQLEWPLVDIMALEDAAGDRCVRRWLMQSIPEVEEALCFMRSAGELAIEGGEAVQALTKLAMGKGCKVETRKQLSDVISSAKRTVASLEGEGE